MELQNSKCFIWCRLRTAKPFFLSFTCFEAPSASRSKCGTARPIANGPVESTSRAFLRSPGARRFGAAGPGSPARGQRARTQDRRQSSKECGKKIEHREREYEEV